MNPSMVAPFWGEEVQATVTELFSAEHSSATNSGADGAIKKY
jgi:hypothetical protein